MTTSQEDAVAVGNDHAAAVRSALLPAYRASVLRLEELTPPRPPQVHLRRPTHCCSRSGGAGPCWLPRPARPPPHCPRSVAAAAVVGCVGGARVALRGVLAADACTRRRSFAGLLLTGLLGAGVGAGLGVDLTVVGDVPQSCSAGWQSHTDPPGAIRQSRSQIRNSVPCLLVERGDRRRSAARHVRCNSPTVGKAVPVDDASHGPNRDTRSANARLAEFLRARLAEEQARAVHDNIPRAARRELLARRRVLEFHAHDTDAASACTAVPCLTLVLLALRYRDHAHLPPDALQWPR